MKHNTSLSKLIKHNKSTTILIRYSSQKNIARSTNSPTLQPDDAIHVASRKQYNQKTNKEKASKLKDRLEKRNPYENKQITNIYK